MKTASQFAEEISAITSDLPGDDSGDTAIVPVEPAPVAEEIADWRGPLQDIQVRLRRMIQQDIDKFMESANKILQDAEKSDWSKVAIQNSVARWSKDINRVYADFKNSTQGFMKLVKTMGITTRRHSTKNKAPSKRGKMDWGKLTNVQLKKEVRDQIKRLSGGIHSLADDGSFMLHQIDRILKYKAPKDETVREEIGALHQDFVDFRNAFGSKVWGPYNGLIGRLNSVRDQPLPQRSKAYRSAMRKKPGQMVAGTDIPIDCPELREAVERDRIRATNSVMGENQDEAAALIEGIEDELLGEAEADKMKAKGYKFKILLKDKAPLYAKTEKGAKDVQKDYPGSKIVANESEEIDDPAVIEAAENGDLFDFFEDFDALLYGEEDDALAEGASDPAPFLLSEWGRKRWGPRITAKNLDTVPIGHWIGNGFDAVKRTGEDIWELQNLGGMSKVRRTQVERIIRTGKWQLAGELGEGENAPSFPLSEAKPVTVSDVETAPVGTSFWRGQVEAVRTGPKTWTVNEYKTGSGKVVPHRTKHSQMVFSAKHNEWYREAGLGKTPPGMGEATEFEKGVRIADGPSRQKMAIQQVFGFLRLKGGTVEPGPGGKFMHGIVGIPGGKLEFDADRKRLAWTAFANGSIVDKGHSPYGGSINRMTKPIAAAMKKVAATTEGTDPGGDDLTEMSQVANTIFKQFGGGRAMMMIGGKASTDGANKLTIKWPNKQRSKGNVVTITYERGADLYTMEFFNSTSRAHKSVKKFTGLYADMLVPTFEKQTGWYLHL